jgi:pyruvate formate lyase activating enzyme
VDTALVDRARCAGSGACADACPTEALRLAGRPMTVAQAIAIVERDRPFFEASGGGLTVSGGEPAWPGHGRFVRDLLRAARRRRISTWVETCGAAPWRIFASWLPYLGGVLYDLKAMDPARHRRATGAGNALILRNARRLAAAPGVRLHLRVPLIPGLNDTPNELAQLSRFVQSLPGPPPVEVLPYHTYGVRKYALLDRPYSLHGLAPDMAGVARAHETLAAHGLLVLPP